MTIHKIVGDLAQDMRAEHWDKATLERICAAEVIRLKAQKVNIPVHRLVHKVQGAYIKQGCAK
jgi:hypothetical protein